MVISQKLENRVTLINIDFHSKPKHEFYLNQELAKIFCKTQDSVLGFADLLISTAITPLCCCTREKKKTMDDPEIEIRLQEEVKQELPE